MAITLKRSGFKALVRQCGPRYRSVMPSSHPVQTARFHIGQIVRHRMFPFRGVIFDVDPEFDNTEEWYLSIPEEARPRKDQPFYHLLAENSENEYIAYVSEQNLELDESGAPVGHPQVAELFDGPVDGMYRLKPARRN